MRAFRLEVPESLLAERRRLGIDRWDEMWEGVLHVVPQPTSWHQQFGAELIMALGPTAKAKGLGVFYETALYRADKDYRVPDLTFALPVHRTTRGIEGGAELVVEILSPDDETDDKMPFYAAVGVREVLVINPDTRVFTLSALNAEKAYVPVAADTQGLVRCETLGVSLATRPGPRLEVVAAGVTTSI